VINQSLVGLIEACMASDRVEGIYGAHRGIQGILDEDFYDLSNELPENLEGVAVTPCAALRSIRKKPTHDDCERVLEVFQAHNVRYFFYIGGNDSAETALILNKVAVAEGYDIRLFHVPKTVDNDLLVTDHCPGYGSAARFVALALMGDNEDNRSLPGIKVDVIMGRDAGWLTAASRLARTREEDGPHLIYVPERVFDMDSFLGDVEDAYKKYGRCLIAVSEGIHDAQGQLIAKSKETDAFGNQQLSGSGALGDQLVSQIKKLGDGLRVRADTFGYLQRSFFGIVSKLDCEEAREVGHAAVRFATEGDAPHGSVVIQRDGEGMNYTPRYELAAIHEVARNTKVLEERYIVGDNGICESFLDYVAPLVGELPHSTRLSAVRVPKKLE